MDNVWTPLTLCWHPRYHDVLFASTGDHFLRDYDENYDAHLKDSIKNGINAINVNYKSVVKTYPHFNNSVDFQLKTFKEKPYLAAANGMCPGSMCLIARPEAQFGF